MNMYMGTTILISFPLVPPLKLASSWNIHSGTPSTIIMHSVLFPAPRNKFSSGFTLCMVFIITLCTRYLIRTKISWPDPPSAQHVISEIWTGLGIHDFVIMGRGEGGCKVIHAWSQGHPTQVREKLTNGQDNTYLAEIPSRNPFKILGWTFVCKHDDTQKRAEVKDFML